MAGWVAFSALPEKAAESIRCPWRPRAISSTGQVQKQFLNPIWAKFSSVRIAAWTAIAKCVGCPQTSGVLTF
jgi:hypothetical protein